MSNELEKDLNDEVYEDSFYDNEEELDEDEESEETEKAPAAPVAVEEEEDEEEEIGETRIAVSFACDDCDYRWDDVIVRAKDDYIEDDDISATCPMCGSMNVSQI